MDFEVRHVPLHDSGIGREAGYANDEEFRAAMAAERAAMPPHERAIIEQMNAQMDREFLFGPGA